MQGKITGTIIGRVNPLRPAAPGILNIHVDREQYDKMQTHIWDFAESRQICLKTWFMPLRDRSDEVIICLDKFDDPAEFEPLMNHPVKVRYKLKIHHTKRMRTPFVIAKLLSAEKTDKTDKTEKTDKTDKTEKFNFIFFSNHRPP